MNFWVLLYRFAWALLIVLFTIGLVCAFLPRCHRLREFQRKKADLQEENRKLEEGIQTLRHQQQRFLTAPGFVERTARETGMVKSDEVVFKFTNEQSAAKTTR